MATPKQSTKHRYYQSQIAILPSEIAIKIYARFSGTRVLLLVWAGTTIWTPRTAKQTPRMCLTTHLSRTHRRILGAAIPAACYCRNAPPLGEWLIWAHVGRERVAVAAYYTMCSVPQQRCWTRLHACKRNLMFTLSIFWRAYAKV